MRLAFPNLSNLFRAVFVTFGALVVAGGTGSSARAELQITELMVNPIGDDAVTWEWLEVRNIGAEPVDLNGYIINKLNFDQDDAATISNAGVAMIPAGGIAVLYDGPADGVDDDLFRAAWSLGPSVTLVSVPNLPALSNSGDNRNLGFWANNTDYMADWIDDGQEGFDVGSYANAALSIDYAIEGFPGVSSGVSNAWNGSGDYRAAANWSASEQGVAGAFVSTPVVSPGTPINSTDDAGSPGILPQFGTPAGGLLITEIMYNPASDDDDWEWIEIYNNTGAAIDFNATPYVLDDIAGGNLSGPNVSSGVLGDGETGVLFDGDSLTQQNFQDAWDPGGDNGTSFIAVSNWSPLNNGGDEFGLWDDFAAYVTDSSGEDRVTTNAAVAIAYDDAFDSEGEPTIWPSDDGDGSIYLLDLGADPSSGGSWDISLGGSGDAFYAAESLASVEVHPGGELGSPGVFGDTPPSVAADFNGDMLVDGADLAIWETAFGSAATAETGDATGDGLATGDDLLVLQRLHTGPGIAAAVPEPTTAITTALAFATISVWRRRT